MDLVKARRRYRESRSRAADVTERTPVRSFEESAARFGSRVLFEGDQWDRVAVLDRAVVRHQRVLASIDPVFVRLRVRQILATFAAKRFGRISSLSGDWINMASEVFGPESSEVTTIRECQRFVRTASGRKAGRLHQVAEWPAPDLLHAPAVKRLSARYRKAGLWAESVRLRTRFIERLAEEYGNDHDTVLQLRTDLAFDHLSQGEPEPAIPLFERLAEQRAAKEPDRLEPLGEAIRMRVHLAFAYLCMRRPGEAEQILVPLAARLKEARSDAPRIPMGIAARESTVEGLLGRSQWQRGEHQSAQRHFERAYLLAPATGGKADREDRSNCFNCWIYSLEHA
ncbi:tetratricopeptide repeat protein [Actinomadura opuntiae]|uniref:tetratricopeptide repeat protein n=1 Tax=Actinomadura sp. OS1-43 TaxID=604315 RepID=UPI00255AF831|nr:tetratricopeptide repeat protein [Actinomadura sp. OS1-43]MDL4817214.1 tetratricopeptide repeat protein [Actinomadura sp. OS1-43]